MRKSTLRNAFLFIVNGVLFMTACGFLADLAFDLPFDKRMVVEYLSGIIWIILNWRFVWRV